MVDSDLKSQMLRSFIYRRPTHRRRNALVPILAAILTLELLLMPFLTTHSADAGSGPKLVSGHVYDYVGTPVTDTNVTVNMKNGMTVRKTLTNTTNTTGGYRVTFSPSDWVQGDTIEVIADIDDPTNSSTAIADDNPSQTVDVNLSVQIPEFQTHSVVVLFTGAMVLFFFNYRRKSGLQRTRWF